MMLWPVTLGFLAQLARLLYLCIESGAEGEACEPDSWLMKRVI